MTKYQPVWPSGPTAAERVRASVAASVAAAKRVAKPAPVFTVANPTRVRVA